MRSEQRNPQRRQSFRVAKDFELCYGMQSGELISRFRNRPWTLAIGGSSVCQHSNWNMALRFCKASLSRACTVGDEYTSASSTAANFWLGWGDWEVSWPVAVFQRECMEFGGCQLHQGQCRGC